MGIVLMILCIVFCVGVLIYMLSTDAQNVVCDEEGDVLLTRDNAGNITSVITEDQQALDQDQEA